MNKFFAQLIATLFVGAMLTATSHADNDKGPGWYCVKMPTHGQTGWTRRDNEIRLRVVVRAGSNRKDAKGKPIGPRNAIYDIDGKPAVRAGSVHSEGYDTPHRFKHGGRNVCVPMFKIVRQLQRFDPQILIEYVRIHVQYQSACPKVAWKDMRKNHLFRIWQRSGNLVYPFGCGVLRPHIDSPWPAVKNLHEQVKKPPLADQIWFVNHRSLPWNRLLFKWDEHPSAVGTGIKERAQWDRPMVRHAWRNPSAYGWKNVQ
ncbi:MAG: hypothetical protein ACR2P7_02395, partial [bacterium]